MYMYVYVCVCLLDSVLRMNLCVCVCMCACNCIGLFERLCVYAGVYVRHTGNAFIKKIKYMYP